MNKIEWEFLVCTVATLLVLWVLVHIKIGGRH